MAAFTFLKNRILNKNDSDKAGKNYRKIKGTWKRGGFSGVVA
jgi:hypothetical protein